MVLRNLDLIDRSEEALMKEEIKIELGFGFHARLN